MRVVCDPNPFCFGSVSALRAIMGEAPGIHWIVLATGPVGDLCDDTFERVPCDVKDPRDVALHAKLIRSADVYVAVSNNTNVPLVLELDVPLVFIDILFWMKRQVTDAMRHARTYVIERFPGVEERLRRYPAANARLVGPLVEAALERRPTTHDLFVNLGGAASPELQPGITTAYPDCMTGLVSRIAQQLDLPHVPVAMGSAAVASVRPYPRTAPQMFPQPQYLGALASCRRFLTAPGLNAPFEAFRMGVPTSFLVPQNLTQVAQLDVYERAGIAPRGLNLPDLVPEVTIDLEAPEVHGTGQVLAALARLNDRRMARIEGLVLDQLGRSRTDDAAQAAAQTRFVETLGTPGGGETAKVIQEAACASAS